ncbi:MAG: hypothetical protein QNK35_17520 [Bacteroides sp.]|nr:hypothetical protein [Bacteroides sp.]
MKKRISVVVFMILYGLVLNSCNKDDNKPDDFRDKYIGQYQVHEKISSYGFPECGEPYSREKDTIIVVNYGNTDSTLDVLGRDVYLDSAGNYYDYHYGLRLWNDSISSYFMNGGLGCGRNEVYKGYRISDQP